MPEWEDILENCSFKIDSADAKLFPKLAETLRIDKSLKDILVFINRNLLEKSIEFTCDFRTQDKFMAIRIKPEIDNQYLFEMEFDVSQSNRLDSQLCAEIFIQLCLEITGVKVSIDEITRHQKQYYKRNSRVFYVFLQNEKIHWNFQFMPICKHDDLRVLLNIVPSDTQDTLKKNIEPDQIINIYNIGKYNDIYFSPDDYFDYLYDLLQQFISQFVDNKKNKLNVRCFMGSLDMWKVIESWDHSMVWFTRRQRVRKYIKAIREPEPMTWIKYKKVLIVLKNGGDLEKAVEEYNECIKQRNWRSGIKTRHSNMFIRIVNGQPEFIDRGGEICDVCGVVIDDSMVNRIEIPSISLEFMGKRRTRYSVFFCCQSDKCRATLPLCRKTIWSKITRMFIYS